jgi:hypothetical protein
VLITFRGAAALHRRSTGSNGTLLSTMDHAPFSKVKAAGPGKKYLVVLNI